VDATADEPAAQVTGSGDEKAARSVA
jgi:hypothetical protein